MRPERLEVAVAGDASAGRVRSLALRYLGSLPGPAISPNDTNGSISISFGLPRIMSATRQGKYGAVCLNLKADIH